MTHIKYSALTTEEVIVVNSEEFRSVLKAHPNLVLVTVEETNEGKEILHRMTLPLTDGYDDFIAVVDKDNDNAFMWVVHDDWVAVSDPSPAFIEILKVMDAYSVKTWQERIFTPRQEERLYADHPEILASTFDFTTGEYIRNSNLNNNNQKDETMSKQENVEIRYFGYSYDGDFHFLNSQEMKDFLAKHDYLKIVVDTIDPETDEEFLRFLSFPITSEDVDGPIMILDTRLDPDDWEEHALFIHHEDDAYAINPSPEFMEILHMMEADFTKNGEEFELEYLD